MNVEIGAEAALFPKKEYNRIFVAVFYEITHKSLNRFIISSSFIV